MIRAISTVETSPRLAPSLDQPKTLPQRLTSIDAYRGFVMLLMASEGLRLAAVARNFPDSHLWAFLARHTDHVQWQGNSLWDMIQPSFMFLVGVALVLSVASRRAKGQT